MVKKTKRESKSVSYTEHLSERLKNPKEAAAYLNAALEDEDPRVFLVALKDVAEAHGGLTKLAKEAELNRENLYRTLSTKGNPRLDSLLSILDVFKLHICIRPVTG